MKAVHLQVSPVKDNSFSISRFLVFFNSLSYHCHLRTHRHLQRISSAPDMLPPLCFACNHLIVKWTTNTQEILHNQANKPQTGIYRATPSHHWGLAGLAQASLPWTENQKFGQVKCTRSQQPEDKTNPEPLYKLQRENGFPEKDTTNMQDYWKRKWVPL